MHFVGSLFSVDMSKTFDKEIHYTVWIKLTDCSTSLTYNYALVRLCVVDVDSPCSEFDGGTPLHIAAQNLAIESAKVLLANAAYPFAVDLNGKLPLGKCHSEFVLFGQK